MSTIERPIEFALMLDQIGARSAAICDLFGVNKRTVNHWRNGRNGEIVDPPEMIYTAVYNFVLNYRAKAQEVAADELITHLITYPDEASFMRQFPHAYFGRLGHHALLSMIMALNPNITTISSVLDESDRGVSWNNIANVAVEFDFS